MYNDWLGDFSNTARAARFFVNENGGNIRATVIFWIVPNYPRSRWNHAVIRQVIKPVKIGWFFRTELSRKANNLLG